MSNPVAPPPPTDEGAPLAAPQQGFGDAPTTFPIQPAKKRNAALKVVLRIVLIIVIAGVGYFVKDALFGDKAKNAAVGDCIAAPKDAPAEKSDVNAEVVDCTSSKAAYTVKGRVNGETSTSSKSCDKFFAEEQEFAIYSSTADGGYLLCLEPKA